MEVLSYLGYKNNTADENIIKQIEDCTSEIQSLLRKTYTYKIFDCEVTDNKVNLKDTVISLEGRDIAKHLKSSQKCAMLAVTLGIEVDRMLAYYSKINLSTAVVMDACASVIVEEICDKVQREIGEEAKKLGLYITDRYSPGYGDLTLKNQLGILRVLDAERTLGLTLTENYLLQPQKSVTAIIGLQKNKYKEKFHKCKKCNLQKCEFRKAGIICE